MGQVIDQQGVQERMHHMAARIRLVGGRETGPLDAQVEVDLRVIRRVRVGMRLKEPVPAFQRRCRPGEPGIRQIGRGNAAMRGPARMQLLGLRPVAETFHHPRRLADGGADGVAEPAGIQAEQFSGDNGRRDGADDAGRMETAPVKAARRGAADPAARLGARHHGREHGLPIRPQRLAERQSGGDDRPADMDDRFIVGVVVVEGVGERAVGDRGGGGRGPVAETEDTAFVAVAEAKRRFPHGRAAGHCAGRQ
jgi:hypothetical protein